MRKTEKTLECLREWIEESSKDDFNAYKKDQDALDNVLRKESICRIAIKTLSSSFIEVRSFFFLFGFTFPPSSPFLSLFF